MPGAGAPPTTIAVVTDDGREVVVVRVPAGPPDLGVVDQMARLRLVAARTGNRLVVRGVTDDLRALLALVGLAEVVLGLEPGGQAELLEELGADEVVQPGDAAA